MATDDKAALVIIDAQQEYFVHESRRPGAATFVPGSPALEIHPEVRPAAGEPAHLGSLSGFLAEIKRTDDITG